MAKAAELALTNGAIYSVDTKKSWAEAMAINGGEITFVGSKNDLANLIGPNTRVINLEGNMVLPGFVDAHAHASMAMDLVGNISLYTQDSPTGYPPAISSFIQEHPERKFYRGSGWADTFFPNLGPKKEILDQVCPDKPLALLSYDCHSLWVNSEALKQANVNSDTPDPDGGRIERNPDNGEPSGTLRETAMKLVEEVIPPHSLEERKNALAAYQQMAGRAGITMCHDPMLDAKSIEAYDSLSKENNLMIRFRGSITLDPHKDLDDQIEILMAERARHTHPNFQTPAAKIFVDGVVEGGTAYLHDPYSHKPDFTGEPLWHADQLKAACITLDKLKFQIHFHVIGDAAATITLDALESALDANGPRDSRHLITHLQLVKPEDIARLARLNIVGVPQPFWFKLDDYYSELALPYLGKTRADRQYPMQSLLELGVVMASSSDFPVTIPFDPLIGIQTGVTRTSRNNEYNDPLWPEECASLEDMILSYTKNGAYANFLEHETGSIEVGKHADLVVLDQNIFELPKEAISETNVLLTLVDGQELYRSPAFEGSDR